MWLCHGSSVPDSREAKREALPGRGPEGDSETGWSQTETSRTLTSRSAATKLFSPADAAKPGPRSQKVFPWTWTRTRAPGSPVGDDSTRLPSYLLRREEMDQLQQPCPDSSPPASLVSRWRCVRPPASLALGSLASPAAPGGARLPLLFAGYHASRVRPGCANERNAAYHNFIQFLCPSVRSLPPAVLWLGWLHVAPARLS